MLLTCRPKGDQDRELVSQVKNSSVGEIRRWYPSSGQGILQVLELIHRRDHQLRDDRRQEVAEQGEQDEVVIAEELLVVLELNIRSEGDEAAGCCKLNP
jgi:hypothetical protein